MKDGDEDEGVCGAEGRLKKRKGRRGEQERWWLVWTTQTTPLCHNLPSLHPRLFKVEMIQFASNRNSIIQLIQHKRNPLPERPKFILLKLAYRPTLKRAPSRMDGNLNQKRINNTYNLAISHKLDFVIKILHDCFFWLVVRPTSSPVIEIHRIWVTSSHG